MDPSKVQVHEYNRMEHTVNFQKYLKKVQTCVKKEKNICNGTNSSVTTSYINKVAKTCTELIVFMERRSVIGFSMGTGSHIMYTILNLAATLRVDSIDLHALPNVIYFYKKFGFHHAYGCSEVNVEADNVPDLDDLLPRLRHLQLSTLRPYIDGVPMSLCLSAASLDTTKTSTKKKTELRDFLTESGRMVLRSHKKVSTETNHTKTKLPVRTMKLRSSLDP